jgi:predicted O-methyltransferase YrrM
MWRIRENERGSIMDAVIREVLAEYEKRGAEEHKLQSLGTMEEWLARRDEFLIAIGPATGQLLNILAKSVRAKTILEIGTSYGYSTVWLAEAARATGGKLITLDKAGYKQNFARSMLGRAGLASYVEFRLGDALDTLDALKGPFDFVLVDLWKDLYVDAFDLFYPKLAPGALIAADNMILPEDYREDAFRYRKHVRSKPKIDSVLLPVGSGVELSRYADPLKP